MKISTILNEVPLPSDWDSSVFSGGSFKKRIAYAKEKAKHIGSGSGRVAFIIPYEGRDTVLKVAKNGKGMAQDEEEEGMFRTAHALGAAGTVVVPMIDHDTESSRPTWIHTEYARKLKSEQEFKKLTGFELIDLLQYSARISNNNTLSGGFPDPKDFGPEFEKSIWDNEESFAYEFVNFVGNVQVHLADLSRPANWGVYKNHPVIIDLGMSDDVYKKFYQD